MKKRKSLPQIREEMYEAGTRDALQGMLAVMEAVRHQVLEQTKALDVRAAFNTFVDELQEFVAKKLETEDGREQSSAESSDNNATGWSANLARVRADVKNTILRAEKATADALRIGGHGIKAHGDDGDGGGQKPEDTGVHAPISDVVLASER